VVRLQIVTGFLPAQLVTSALLVPADSTVLLLLLLTCNSALLDAAAPVDMASNQIDLTGDGDMAGVAQQQRVSSSKLVVWCHVQGWLQLTCITSYIPSAC
jgi:hypothetical protein